MERVQPHEVTKSLSVIIQNVWTGCCAVALSEQTRLLLGGPLALGPLEGFVFCGALFAYNIIRRGAFPRALAWGFGALALVCLLQLPFFTQCAAIVPFVAWGFYYGAHGLVRVRLRAVPVLKPVTVALVWSWVTVLLPLGSGHWLTAAVLFAGRAAFLFALALACDLSDREVDAGHGLDTLVLRLGVSRSMCVIDVALVASGICVASNWAFGYYGGGVSITLIGSLLLTALCLRGIVWKLSGPQTQKALIDGLMLAQFAAVWLLIAGSRLMLT